MKCIILFSILFIGFCQADFPTEIPDLDDLELLKARCDKKGGVGTFEKIKKSGEESQTCVKALINIDTVKTEVEEAKKTGSMDEVFGKYCGKRPQIYECIKKTNDAIQPCLEDSEKQALNFTTNILKEIVEFACYKNGDRIAMFIAEGGIKCLKSRVENIKDCVNQTVKFNPATFSPNSIPDLTIDSKKCTDLTSIQDCVVKDLEDHCADTTPANIIDALFRFVKKRACKDVKPKRSISTMSEMRSSLVTLNTYLGTEFEKIFKYNCMKNGGVDSYDKLMAAYNASKPCLWAYRMFVTPYGVYRTSLANCTVRSRKAMEDCYGEQEKYYPDFVLELLQSVFGFIYSNVDRIFGDYCMKAINQDETKMEVFECYSEHLNYTIIPPKPELCKKIREFDVCFSNIVKERCIKDIRLTKLIDDLVQSIEAPC